MCDYFIKSESAPSHVCQCCFSENNLKSMLYNFIFEDKIEVYSEMITKCFAIKITVDESTDYFICDLCILRLRDSYNFKNQVDRVQSTFKKKKDEDPKLNTLLTDNLENIMKEDTVKQEYSSEGEFLYCLEIKPPESEESKYTLKKVTKKFELLPKIKKERLTKIRKLSILTELVDEHSNEDTSINNVKINSKSVVRRTGNKRSKEEFREFKRRYGTELYAKSIPFKLDKTDVSCTICNETFTTNRNLVSHMPEHYPNLVCHICGKFALSVKHLYSHLLSHNSEKVACHVCNKLMKKTSMRKHVQRHTGDHFIYRCQYCPEKFSSYNSRLCHLAKEHQVGVMKYKCKVCPKAFQTPGNLSNHVKRCHLQERTVPCPECGKFFFSRGRMQIHMVKHTKEKKFQCALCLKSYGRRYTLSEHMKIHNNEKRHKCTICEKTFTQKCTLKGHMKIHEKPNPQQLGL